MSQSRQLAAIMFTDIVGYTALMGDNEQRAFELLRKNRELQKPIIEQFNGRLIKELGDGIMASFNTVSDAVNAAIKIQKECNVAKDFQLRIGIHLGEVVFENDDVFGDGVNIASRIQTIAIPGGIYISESVHNNVSNKHDITTQFVKLETLKNVKEPVKIYEVMLENFSGPFDLTSKESSKKFWEKSIAVLPFIDMSPAHDQEYLGDGLAEELINLLSQLRDLKVIGRTSSFSFKKKDVDLKTIGKTLNATTILEGSIQKAGNRIRITAQLINTDDGYHIWSQRYDREMDDIFALQDDICSKIAEHLRLTLLKGDETVVEKKPTDNIQAYELYLKGDFNYKKYTAEGFEKAIEYFTKAVELDPNYVDAWWSLGTAYWDTQSWLLVQDKSVIEKVRYCAKKAIEIDEFNPNGHFLLALVYMNADWNWKRAGAEIALGNKYNQKQEAGFLPLEPFYRGMLYGDFDFAVRQLQKAIDKDPLSVMYLLFLALIYLYGIHNYEQTRIILYRILQLNNHFIEAWRPMCLSYLFEGKFALAMEYAQKYYHALEGKGQGAVSLIMCLAASGEREQAEQLYQLVKQTLPPSQFSASLHAKANAYLGKVDEAFQYLDKTLEEGDLWLAMTLKYSPEWDILRPDPRFQEVLRRMNFPE
jgi:adenylate cyclase